MTSADDSGPAPTTGATHERVARALRRFAELTLRHRDAAQGLGRPLRDEERALLEALVDHLDPRREGAPRVAGAAALPSADEGRLGRLGGAPAAPPGSLRESFVEVGGERLLVLSYPLEDDADEGPHASLTPAERAVALLAASGLTTAQVAAARRTSVRTVVKQIDAVYRKLGVHSRRELVRRLSER